MSSTRSMFCRRSLHQPPLQTQAKPIGSFPKLLPQLRLIQPRDPQTQVGSPLSFAAALTLCACLTSIEQASRLLSCMEYVQSPFLGLQADIKFQSCSGHQWYGCPLGHAIRGLGQACCACYFHMHVASCCHRYSICCRSSSFFMRITNCRATDEPAFQKTLSL